MIQGRNSGKGVDREGWYGYFKNPRERKAVSRGSRKTAEISEKVKKALDEMGPFR